MQRSENRMTNLAESSKEVYVWLKNGCFADDDDELIISAFSTSCMLFLLCSKNVYCLRRGPSHRPPHTLPP
jgi:hypothetical protein